MSNTCVNCDDSISESTPVVCHNCLKETGADLEKLITKLDSLKSTNAELLAASRDVMSACMNENREGKQRVNDALTALMRAIKSAEDKP